MSESTIWALFAAVVLAGCAARQGTGSTQPKPSEALTPSVATPANPTRPQPWQILAVASANPAAPLAGDEWKPLYDGKSLAGWQATPFGGAGTVEIQSGLIVLWMGDPFTGIRFTNTMPKINYEVSLEAMRVQGTDFFCGLTFPVNDAHCSLICGGWGGSIVGLSSLDGQDASENETTQFMNFKPGEWYRIRLRVTADRIEAWIDDKGIIDVAVGGKRLTLRGGDIELSKPFGIASWRTSAALRGIQIRPLSGPVHAVR